MKKYYINRRTDTNPNNNNEIHADGCYRMPTEADRVSLGYFNNAIEAKNFAISKGFTKADGCYHCSSEAHEE